MKAKTNEQEEWVGQRRCPHALQDDLLLGFEDGWVNVDAHVGGRAGDDPHGRLQGRAVQIGELLGGYRLHLVNRHLPHLLPIRLVGTLLDPCFRENTDDRLSKPGKN